MSKVLNIREMRLGEGKPKICIPITGRNEKELLEEIITLKSSCCDVVEWRVDFFDEIHKIEKIKETLKELRISLGNIPVLFTFRTAQEGGNKEIAKEDYLNLYKQVIATGEIDLLDVELFMGDDVCSELIAYAHEYKVYVVVSSHDFQKTPEKEILVSRLIRMRELGADIPKVAVMPESSTDVLTLLCATDEYVKNYADCPVITMSMKWLGAISRIAGEFFGSSLTFAAAKHVSAPGQMAVSDVNMILKVLHNSNNG